MELHRVFSRQRAFTLVELLVVLLIIGILIAVAAPSFLGQQQKAQDSAAKQQLVVAYRDLKSQWASGGQSYNSLEVNALAASEPQLGVSPGYAWNTPSDTTHVYVSVPVNGGQQALLSMNSASGTTFLLKDNGGPTRLSFPGGGLLLNLIGNPSFEYDTTGQPPAGWSASPGADSTSTFAVSSGWASAGTKSLRMTFATVAGATYPRAELTTAVTVAPSTGYSLDYSDDVLSLPLGGSSFEVMVQWLNASSGVISTYWSPLQSSLGTGSDSTEITSPAGAVSAVLSAYFNSAGAGTADAYVNGVSLTRSATPVAYFDGDSASSAWSGTPGASTSFQAAAASSW